MCFFCGCSGPYYKSVKVITPSTLKAAMDKKSAPAPVEKKENI